MNEWIEWDGTNGGHPDLPLDTVVEVRFRDGVEVGGCTVDFWWSSDLDANNWAHGSEEPDAEIVAYRVAK